MNNLFFILLPETIIGYAMINNKMIMFETSVDKPKGQVLKIFDFFLYKEILDVLFKTNCNENYAALTRLDMSTQVEDHLYISKQEYDILCEQFKNMRK